MNFLKKGAKLFIKRGSEYFLRRVNWFSRETGSPNILRTGNTGFSIFTCLHSIELNSYTVHSKKKAAIFNPEIINFVPRRERGIFAWQYVMSLDRKRKIVQPGVIYAFASKSNSQAFRSNYTHSYLIIRERPPTCVACNKINSAELIVTSCLSKRFHEKGDYAKLTRIAKRK